MDNYPVFPPTSIFYRPPPPPSTSTAPISQERNTEAVQTESSPSRNDIFFQNFAITRPPSSTQQISDQPPSKNDLFFQDVATSHPLRNSHKKLTEVKKSGSFEALTSSLDSSFESMSSHRSGSVDILTRLLPTSPNRMAVLCNNARSVHDLKHEKVPIMPCVVKTLNLADDMIHPSEIMSPIDTLSRDTADLFFVPAPQNILGQGRYADVFKASIVFKNEPSITKSCVVKRLHHDRDAQTSGYVEAYVLRMLHEWAKEKFVDVKATSALQRPYGPDHIIECLGMTGDLDERTGNFKDEIPPPMIILPYCSLGSLDTAMRSFPHLVTRRNYSNWCRQLASAIEFLQTPHTTAAGKMVAVIHHDIKPQNVLVTKDWVLKLADFGNAAFVHVENGIAETLTDGLGRGTQVYTAPEILTPPLKYGLPSDIYSLGCTFFAILTGDDPFKSITNPAQQLLAIRRGFFGFNSLYKTAFSQGKRHARGHSQTDFSGIQKAERSIVTTVPISAPATAATQFDSSETIVFQSGDILHSHEAQDKLVAVLRRCVERLPEHRFTIRELIVALDELDDLLIFGDEVLPK